MLSFGFSELGSNIFVWRIFFEAVFGELKGDAGNPVGAWDDIRCHVVKGGWEVEFCKEGVASPRATCEE